MGETEGTEDNPIVYFDEGGNGPIYHVCEGGGASRRVLEWLDRAKLTGIDPKVAAEIERMADDLA